MSADFKTHPVAILTAELFERHDRSRFETVAVSYGVNDNSALRARVANAFDTFLDVQGLSDAAVADRMRAMEIDIAVELTGFTENCRPGILALRPAPIQVNYLGYLGTTGADFIDYVVSDRFALPDAIRAHYSEKVAYLPDTYLVADTTRRVSQTPPRRADLGLPEDGMVFCAFHSPHKITPYVFDVWMRLLRAVDRSVLWLAGSGAVADQALRREAQARGVAPERVVVMPRVSTSEDYLARYTLADLFLDTLPYNAVSTAADALWAGLPILTCAGNTLAGRGAGSPLRAVGLSELVCDTLAAYEAKALELARDRARLAELRRRLIDGRRGLPLFDTDRFRRHLEAAYATMWERSQRGEPPADFDVPAG